MKSIFRDIINGFFIVEQITINITVNPLKNTQPGMCEMKSKKIAAQLPDRQVIRDKSYGIPGLGGFLFGLAASHANRSRLVKLSYLKATPVQMLDKASLWLDGTTMANTCYRLFEAFI